MIRATAFVRRLGSDNEVEIIKKTKIFEILMKNTYTNFINSIFSIKF